MLEFQQVEPSRLLGNRCMSLGLLGQIEEVPSVALPKVGFLTARRERSGRNPDHISIDSEVVPGCIPVQHVLATREMRPSRTLGVSDHKLEIWASARKAGRASSDGASADGELPINPMSVL